jgi:phosphate starvation-inducible PhoH-like protein
MARKAQTYSKRTRYDRYEETIQKTTEAVVSYDIPKKKFAIHDLKHIQPKNYSQQRVFDNYKDDVSQILTGSAGTGKTMISMFLAIHEILGGETPFKRLVVIRSTAEVRSLGFLPGTIEDKTEPFEAPYKSLCDDIFKRPGQYDKLKEIGAIEFISTSFVRGITLSNCIVMIDESQNLNWQEISSCITRAGNHCKFMVCGDTKQSDLLYKKTDVSGLDKFIQVAMMIPSFRGVAFTPEDIVRSGLCKEFIIAEERYEETRSRRD